MFPSAVAHQVAFLKDLLDESVGAVVPAARPPSFVVVERAGGTQLSPGHDAPMVTYRCTAESLVKAEVLAQKVRGLVRGQQEFIREVGGPVPLPDPDDGLPRYQFTVLLRLREA